MTALIAAAKKEGQLNVITLPSNWANYGTIMKDFTAKYGIKINDANPDGSSQDELNAVNQLKGQSRAPDVLDVGTAFGVKGDQEGILAPYQVTTWSNIPSDAKASDGTYYADYGGYVAIGYNSAQGDDPADLVRGPAEADLQERGCHQRQPDPGERRVLGRLRLGAGQRRLAQQHRARHRVLQETAQPWATSCRSQPAQRPWRAVRRRSSIWWDYLLASEIGPSVPGLKIVIPSDASYAAYYDQAISKYAPDPAAARLWEEYLYSTTGQNLWLEGEARPIELPTLVSSGTVNQAAYKALPPAPSGSVTFPTQSQQAAAEAVVAQQWSSVIG